MIFQLDDKAVADDTILVFGIGYPGSNSNRIYTYAGMKVAGRWYFTGSGRTPQDAGWAAVQRWLASDGRRVVWVKVPTRMEPLWQDVPEEPLSAASQIRDDAESRLKDRCDPAGGHHLTPHRGCILR